MHCQHSKKCNWILIVTAACTLFSKPIFSLSPEDVIVLDANTINGQLIGKKVEYIFDDTKKITINNITSPETEAMFKHSVDDTLNFGQQTDKNPNIWIRFMVSNPGKADFEWIVELNQVFMQNFDLYIPEGGGKYKVKKSFINDPWERREIKHPNRMFSIIQKPGTATYFIRCNNNGELIIPLKIWTYRSLVENVSDLYMFIAFFYGIMGILLIYNIFIFVSVRDREYLAYIVNIIAFIFLYLNMDGFGISYIWRESSIWIKDHALGTSIFLGHFTSLLFTRSYLQTRKKTRSLDYIILFFLVIELLVFGYLFVDHSTAVGIQVVLGLLEMLFMAFVVSLRHIFMRSRPARFYVLAYWFLIAGWVLRTMGTLGSMESNIFTMWGPQIGTIAMMTLFSLGLADKINFMKNELADLNENLEQKVRERTVELNAAMEELAAMNENLKSTMNELEATNEQLVQTRDALWGEMQLAKKIQTVLLPVDPKMKGYEIAAYMETADEVGGDYYDLIYEAGKYWIVIGDVSGHGVTAGLVMMMVQTAIHTALYNQKNLSPANLLENINRTITENIHRLGENKYMTITVFACIDSSTFHFAGLHQDIIIYREATKTVEMIATDGMWIGLFDELTGMLPENQFTMHSGDMVLLYTDGITEARAESEAMYGEDQLVNLFSQHASDGPERVKDAIISSLENYKKNDDISLMVFKRL